METIGLKLLLPENTDKCFTSFFFFSSLNLDTLDVNESQTMFKKLLFFTMGLHLAKYFIWKLLFVHENKAKW